MFPSARTKSPADRQAEQCASVAVNLPELTFCVPVCRLIRDAASYSFPPNSMLQYNIIDAFKKWRQHKSDLQGASPTTLKALEANFCGIKSFLVFLRYVETSLQKLSAVCSFCPPTFTVHLAFVILCGHTAQIKQEEEGKKIKCGSLICHDEQVFVTHNRGRVVYDIFYELELQPKGIRGFALTSRNASKLGNMQ